jgi:hypothetical protein
MVKKIRVSRQGLTRCPNCKNHIKVSDPINKTICSFCEMSLAEALGTDTGEVILGSKMVTGGSRALLAATILGLPMVACGTTDPVANDIVADVISTDMNMQPAYGIAMDMVEPPQDESASIDVEPAPDENFMPEYGVPPEDIVESPMDAVEDVDEGMPMALYGMPPANDASSSDDVEEDVEESEDVPNMALYGLPPDDKPDENPS